ncbi:hypothetical protein [Bradyrhizobium sp. LHD-71]|uniref:hypothetical protein n=1 Tax=Bradyrhizobium sp. LHD-71 TaxID=3072141 RepID=UPI00280E8AF7|nr:hypothetical protein [Bradyrhizobium sp. LHD-71]MDQ8729388.1 hypothetical protein [Bradyrhizobium sp. LHD-71]
MAETKRRDEPESKRPKAPPTDKIPPAGPHAKPELTDKERTPGSGVLPDSDPKETEAPTG